MSDFTFIDLFAGIGGFRLALEEHGGKCIGFSEVSSDAINTYCDNYNEDKSSNFGDITKIKNLPDHDILTGGVPCQSWSIAGKNLGFDDERGQLWNDALFLLKQSSPKAFIFENVKGLADPRNHEALTYILQQIKEAGYFASHYLLNAYDYGVPQNRERIYIIGFKDEKFFNRFRLPDSKPGSMTLSDIIGTPKSQSNKNKAGQSLSSNQNGQNDYFLFNDLRGGKTTVHSWDIIETSQKEKHICESILKNRRKKIYGPLDGNPLSFWHIRELLPEVTQDDLNILIEKKILKKVPYKFKFTSFEYKNVSDGIKILKSYNPNKIIIDELKLDKRFKIHKINIDKLINNLISEGVLTCEEERYDFKNTKISTGLDGINRIFLPSSCLYPTLVASDTNDFITDVEIPDFKLDDLKNFFIENIYKAKKFRRITRKEACMIQGFPKDFILPESRPRWMKLIGNSVAVQLVSQLVKQIIKTGIFDEKDYKNECIKKRNKRPQIIQYSLFSDL